MNNNGALKTSGSNCLSFNRRKRNKMMLVNLTFLINQKISSLIRINLNLAMEDRIQIYLLLIFKEGIN
jgi:hypothetical protein